MTWKFSLKNKRSTYTFLRLLTRWCRKYIFYVNFLSCCKKKKWFFNWIPSHLIFSISIKRGKPRKNPKRERSGSSSAPSASCVHHSHWSSPKSVKKSSWRVNSNYCWWAILKWVRNGATEKEITEAGKNGSSYSLTSLSSLLMSFL